MSTVDKLKKKAAEFEQKKQFDRALEVYLQIIEQTGGNEDRDVTVYNRVGDLYLRLNKTDQAVNYYEQAVDLYTDGGYLNNAIALCNKILRHAPARHQIYYKLGKISAKKGFNSDAKKNFLEYADRMHRGGRDGDAFKALQEFADLCPGQDDIRLMLADQLAKAGKTAEANGNCAGTACATAHTSARSAVARIRAASRYRADHAGNFPGAGDSVQLGTGPRDRVLSGGGRAGFRLVAER